MAPLTPFCGTLVGNYSYRTLKGKRGTKCVTYYLSGFSSLIRELKPFNSLIREYFDFLEIICRHDEDGAEDVEMGKCLQNLV